MAKSIQQTFRDARARIEGGYFEEDPEKISTLKLTAITCIVVFLVGMIFVTCIGEVFWWNVSIYPKVMWNENSISEVGYIYEWLNVETSEIEYRLYNYTTDSPYCSVLQLNQYNVQLAVYGGKVSFEKRGEKIAVVGKTDGEIFFKTRGASIYKVFDLLEVEFEELEDRAISINILEQDVSELVLLLKTDAETIFQVPLILEIEKTS